MSTMYPLPEDPLTEWHFWMTEKKASITGSVIRLLKRIWGKKK